MTGQISADELLWEWCRYGWNYRDYGSRPVEEQNWIIDRVKYEMGMILGKNLADFFLFTSDAIRWAKDNGVVIGPGRGSTAASEVAYTTRITEVNPYKYPSMIFERFLDVTRHDPPDIDVDCSDEQRYMVRDYLAYKYGADCVGHIGNFIKYRAKNSLADVARVYNIPLWAKEIVANLAIERSGGDSRADATLGDTFDMFPAAQDVLRQFPDLAKAIRLEGDYRGLSVHACGLMVANSPLTDVCAVYEKDGEKILSIDKIDAEYIDALKLDFLGLSTLGMISRCLKMAGLTLNDLYAIPDTDPEVIDLFRRGDVVGVFQFEGRATRLVNRDVSPEDFWHIVCVNALSRPGPLFSGQTAEFVAVRHGLKAATPLHPIIDKITEHTYGQMIFQEHILQTLRDVGGLEWINVHHIRRIIAKKAGQAAFQQSYEAFEEGAKRLHGIDAQLAEQIWLRLVTAGTYAFNVAHAVSYSLLAFWTAWLKIHYPLEFYAASLQKATEAESQFKLMRDALAHSIDIRPPDLQKSKASWAPVHGDRPALVAGWQQLPKIGAKTALRISEHLAEEPALYWQDLTQIPGVGNSTIERIQAFTTAKDPFGLYRTERRLRAVGKWLRTQKAVPYPTTNGDKLAAMVVADSRQTGGKWQKGPVVVYAGVVRKVEYKDIIEDERSRTGEEVEDILKRIKRPDLVKRATLHMYDTGEEEVYARVNRWSFERLRKILETIHVNHDVVVILGNRIAGFGTPLLVNKIWVIDPDS
jgi:DNA polymerase-3 subunit alpha